MAATILKRDINIDINAVLADLVPMQRLYRHFAGMLNSLVSEKKKKKIQQLQELHANGGGQKDGRVEDQQLQVLRLLADRLGMRWY